MALHIKNLVEVRQVAVSCVASVMKIVSALNAKLVMRFISEKCL